MKRLLLMIAGWVLVCASISYFAQRGGAQTFIERYRAVMTDTNGVIQAGSVDWEASGVVTPEDLTGLTMTDTDTSVGSGAQSDDRGVAIGSGASATYRGVAVGYNAMGFSDGTAIGYGAIGYGGGSALGFLSRAEDWGAALGIEAEGNEGGAAVGAVNISKQHSSGLGSFSTATGYGTVLGSTGLAIEGGVAAGMNAKAYARGIAVGYGAQAQATSIAVGRFASAGVIPDSAYFEYRTESGWRDYRRTLTVSGVPAPDTALNGTYTLDAHGGDAVWATFTKGAASVAFLHDRVEIRSGEDAKYLCETGENSVDHTMWPIWLGSLNAEVSWTITAGGTTDLIRIAPGSEVTEIAATGCGAFGDGAYAAGTGAYAYGINATNTTDHTHFFAGSLRTTNTVKAARFEFSDGAFLISSGGTNLMYVTSGGVTNKVSLTTP